MQAYSVPCWWASWWLWRAGCISQDTYLLYLIVLCFKHPNWILTILMVCCVWILMVSHHWWPFTLKLHFLGRTLDNTMSDSHTQESRQFCGGGWEGGGVTGMSQHSNIDDMWQHRLERVGVQRFVMAKIEDQSGQTLPLSLLSGEGTALLERTRGRGSTTTSRHCQLSRNNNYLNYVQVKITKVQYQTIGDKSLLAITLEVMIGY